jgi:hypothetical protein
MNPLPAPEPLPEDLDRDRVLLERTVRFLALCMEDPEAALRADDPRDLIEGLQNLSGEPVGPEVEKRETRTIQLRPRRSA